MYNIPLDFSNDPGLEFSISHIDVRNLLKNLNANKAQGPDGIHGKIFKNCAVTIAYPLSLIFNTSSKLSETLISEFDGIILSIDCFVSPQIV